MAEIKGYLTLIGDELNCSKISDLLNKEPTWNKEKGEILGNGRLFGHCEWGVETETQLSNELVSTADLLMTTFSCSRETMRQVAQDFNAEWHILFLIRVFDDFPSIYLTPDFVEFAADIIASIGFDIYFP